MMSGPVDRRGAAESQVDQASQLRRLVASRSGESPTVDRAQTTGDERPQAFSIAIASGKGGVGKTTISVNLAIELSRLGYRTLMLDADVGMANADVMCGLAPHRRLDQFLLGTNDSDLSRLAVLAPGGFHLIPGVVGLADRMEGVPELRQRLVEGLEALSFAYDVVLIDTGAGLNWSVLAMLGAVDLGLIVATPEPTSMTDAYALIKCQASTGRGADHVALVVNQADSMEEAEQTYERISRVSAAFLGRVIPHYGSILRDRSVAASVRARVPLLIHEPQSPVSAQIRALAAGLRGQIQRNSTGVQAADRPRRRWWHRWVSTGEVAVPNRANERPTRAPGTTFLRREVQV
jgi:flagellar biosynthesis protein FlhG